MLQIFKMSWDFYFFVARASVVFLIVPRGATPSLQNSTLFTFHQCQNTKSPSKLVSPQRNGSQTLFPRRFHCSALLLTFGGDRTSSFDVNGGHVRMQLTSAARCFVLSSAVILFDPHVKERRRLLATCDRRLRVPALLKKRKKNGSGSLLSLCSLEEQRAERLSVQAQTTRRPFDFWYLICFVQSCWMLPSTLIQPVSSSSFKACHLNWVSLFADNIMDLITGLCFFEH